MPYIWEDSTDLSNYHHLTLERKEHLPYDFASQDTLYSSSLAKQEETYARKTNPNRNSANYIRNYPLDGKGYSLYIHGKRMVCLKIDQICELDLVRT